MLSEIILAKKRKVSANNSPCVVLSTMLLLAFIASSCTPNVKNTEKLVNDSSNVENIATTFTQEVSTETSQGFAPTVDKPRSGLWLGGSPPINKRASGIDTYYKITQSDNPEHLRVTLQFEGIVFDDAYIKFNAIDGAEVINNQRIKWLLKADAISEVSFVVKVPATVSYLSLYTFQNNRGASRAFLLESTQHR